LPWSGGAVCYPVPEIAVCRVGPVAVSAIGVRAAIEGDVACAVSEASDVACAVSEASDVACASSDVACAVAVSTIGVRAEAGAPVAKAAPAVDLTAAILGGAVRYLP